MAETGNQFDDQTTRRLLRMLLEWEKSRTIRGVQVPSVAPRERPPLIRFELKTDLLAGSYADAYVLDSSGTRGAVVEVHDVHMRFTGVGADTGGTSGEGEFGEATWRDGWLEVINLTCLQDEPAGGT